MSGVADMDKDRLFAELVAQHHRGLVAAARAIVGRDDAEEVVQEAWIAAYRAFEKFEGRSAVRTWLYRIVINEAKTKLRAARRRPTQSLEGSSDGPDSDWFGSDGSWRLPPVLWNFQTPDAILQEQNLVECLRKVLASLPEAQRAVLVLRDLEGLEFGEICNVLDVGASNVRVLLHRARNAVYRMVDEYQEKGTC